MKNLIALTILTACPCLGCAHAKAYPCYSEDYNDCGHTQRMTEAETACYQARCEGLAFHERFDGMDE